MSLGAKSEWIALLGPATLVKTGGVNGHHLVVSSRVTRAVWDDPGRSIQTGPAERCKSALRSEWSTVLGLQVFTG